MLGGNNYYNNMSEKYVLEKWIWTELDFDQMDWHDCNIYSIAFCPNEFEIAFDIDYIFKWMKPRNNEKYYKFWISPATLVFVNVHDTHYDIDTTSGLEIDEIIRNNSQKPRNIKFLKRDTEWTWQILCHTGDIELKSAGFEMYIRSEPVISDTQHLGLKKRGGISFNQGKVTT